MTPFLFFAATAPGYGEFVYPAYLAGLVVLGGLLAVSLRRRARERRALRKTGGDGA